MNEGRGDDNKTGGKSTDRRNWVKRHWFLLLCVLLVGVGSWWLWQSRNAQKQVLAPVKADNRVLAEGVVFPVRYAQLVMPLDGTISEVWVREGEQVKKEQPLLRLIRTDYEARVNSSGSDSIRAAAALEQALVNLGEAEREFNRQSLLDQVGATAKQQYDQAKTTVERHRALVAQSAAEYETQKNKLAEAKGILDKTEMRSPMDGTVAYLDVKPGEHATLGTVLVRVADEAVWEIRSDDLTELMIARVRVGDFVQLTFDGLPEVEIPGRVSFIRPYGEKKRGDITYTVTIAPERWDARLRWNMTAQIAITPSF